MSTSEENVTVTERGGGSKDRRDDKHEGGDQKEGGGGFIEKVKDFIHDIGEKIDEAVGFGKPSADVSGIHIPHISLHRADLVVDVLIKNPNRVPVPAAAAAWCRIRRDQAAAVADVSGIHIPHISLHRAAVVAPQIPHHHSIGNPQRAWRVDNK